MKTILFVLVWALFSVGGFATAAPVVINDGEKGVYNPADEYYFVGELSVANPTISFGMEIAPGQVFDFVVNAPEEIDLVAMLSTAPNFGGFALINPSGVYMVFAGTYFTFPVDGDFAAEQWLTISLDGVLGASDYLAFLPGGTLPIGGFLSSPDTNLSFYGGVPPDEDGNGNGGGDTGGSGNGDGGDDGSPRPVPEPPVTVLALLGLAILSLTQKRGRK